MSTTNPTAFTHESLNNTLTTLTPLRSILTSFHHRNKNQHRLSKWWSHASKLRIQLTKLLLSVTTLSSLPQPTRPTAKTSPHMEAITLRAIHLRTRLIPSAYLAFTQLIADRQFAQMGLMLLGVLAQVDSSLATYADGPGVESDTAEMDSPAPVATSLPVSEMEAEEQMKPADIGVAVSRDEVMMDLNVDVDVRLVEDKTKPKKKKRARMDEFDDISERLEDGGKNGSREGEKPKMKKKVKAKGDEFGDIFGGLDKGGTSRTEDKPKSKKKKAKGDELDDIFGGLEKSAKRAKKKERDEFDDIFAGL